VHGKIGDHSMPIVISTPRKRLRTFLEQYLAKESGSSQAPLLRAVMEGLVALNYGEAQPVFKPGARKNSHDGALPYTIRKLKMRALGFADLLKANNFKPAISTVAEAYGLSTEAYGAWRKSKRLAKTTDPLMKSFRAEIAKLEWNEAEILEKLKSAGADYRAQNKFAHKNKKLKVKKKLARKNKK
jgi:hypothetical protein